MTSIVAVAAANAGKPPIGPEGRPRPHREQDDQPDVEPAPREVVVHRHAALRKFPGEIRPSTESGPRHRWRAPTRPAECAPRCPRPPAETSADPVLAWRQGRRALTPVDSGVGRVTSLSGDPTHTQPCRRHRRGLLPTVPWPSPRSTPLTRASRVTTISWTTSPPPGMPRAPPSARRLSRPSPPRPRSTTSTASPSRRCANASASPKRSMRRARRTRLQRPRLADAEHPQCVRSDGHLR
jgi:hypothetical protein